MLMRKALVGGGGSPLEHTFLFAASVFEIRAIIACWKGPFILQCQL